MSKWSEFEIELLRKAVYNDLPMECILRLIPNHSSAAIYAKIDKLGLRLEKKYGLVSEEMVQGYIKNINLKNNVFLSLEKGYIELIKHEEDYSVVQYIGNNSGYCIFGSHLPLIKCYSILKEYEENCLNK